MAEVTASPSDRRTADGPPGADWTAHAADTIESVGGTIRGKTVAPATTVARGVVYGVVVAVLGLAILVLLIGAAVRVGVVYLPGWFTDRPGRSVWATDAILGGIFTLAGL